MKTKQTDFWTGEFGKEYTSRNFFSPSQWDQYYIDNYGVTKIEMNRDFLKDFSLDAKILEVGCNIGMQLRGLQQMGFKNLYGIELQQDAVNRSKEVVKDVNIIQGSGFDIPFKDNYFDIVVTNGVLIHVAPDDHKKIMSEMVRCSKQYIWGFEYYSEELTDLNYRGNSGFLWKANFAKVFQSYFPNLKLVKSKVYPYVSEANKGNQDSMYLLTK